MRYYALNLWWMLPILQIQRLWVLTSFPLKCDFGALDLRLGCFPFDNGTLLPQSDFHDVAWLSVLLSFTRVGRF